MTFYELHEYFRGRDIQWQRGWESSRLIVAALTGMAPIDIIRLPDIDKDKPKLEWTPELAEQTLKHFGEWQT
jgi:hypothetical protein